jgi:hypothetical protein
LYEKHESRRAMAVTIPDRLARLRQRIGQAAAASGRRPATVRLVAVGKTHPADRLREAVHAGVQILGENYIQEAREKIAALADLTVSWHFIGHLQTNKARIAVRLFDLIHTVDSLRLARELDKEAAKIGKRQDVLLEVNIGAEESKSGVTADQAPGLALQIGRLAHLNLCGLMTIPPLDEDPEKSRPHFAALRGLRDQMAATLNTALPELSMGMSADVEVAISEGATLVRVGTAIFGQRR